MKLKSFPTAHSILLIVAVFVAILTWLIPSGKYEQLEYNAEKDVFIQHSKDLQTEHPATKQTLDSFKISLSLESFTSGAIWKPVGIPNTYYHVTDNPQGITDLVQSPIKGFIGAGDVILFVLVIGGFIGIVHKSGAFDAGVSRLAVMLKGRETLLILIVAFLMALGATTFGLAEETIAFYPILIPVFLAAGYDVMVPLATIFIGTAIGSFGATVNPFSVIIASNAAGINWTTGITDRLVIFVVGFIFVTWYIIRYAEKVRKDPTKSVVYSQKDAIEKHFLANDITHVEALNTRIKLILLCFMATFVAMIYGVSQLGWWFEEMTTTFLVGAIVIAIIARLSEKETVETFIKGANDLLGVSLIIGLARGVTVLMDEGLISDTLLYYSSGAVEGLPAIVFVNMMMFIYSGLTFFISSSSGMAVLTMPIFAPLADTVGIGREHVVSAYLYGISLLSIISPTGLILASLSIAKVSYKDYLKFIMPIFFGYMLIAMIVLSVSLYI